jgi:hypothetical protein
MLNFYQVKRQVLDENEKCQKTIYSDQMEFNQRIKFQISYRSQKKEEKFKNKFYRRHRDNMPLKLRNIRRTSF